MDTFLLDAGNLFLFLSGFLMLYTAFKDRKVLRGYNLPGTVLIVLAIGLALAYYAQQGYWLSFALTLPNWTYWLIVCSSILRLRFHPTSEPATSAPQPQFITRADEEQTRRISMPTIKVDGAKKSHKVFLYTLSTCGWCKKTKELLNEKGVAYEYLDVDTLKAEERKAAVEDLHKRNAPLGFPVIIVDDKEIISGYQPEKIMGALGL